MKKMDNKFYIYVKKPTKKAHYHTSSDGITCYNSLDGAEQEANNIYTGEQEVTIRQAWHTEKGYTGQDIIFTYPIINY